MVEVPARVFTRAFQSCHIHITHPQSCILLLIPGACPSKQGIQVQLHKKVCFTREKNQGLTHCEVILLNRKLQNNIFLLPFFFFFLSFHDLCDAWPASDELMVLVWNDDYSNTTGIFGTICWLTEKKKSLRKNKYSIRYSQNEKSEADTGVGWFKLKVNPIQSPISDSTSSSPEIKEQGQKKHAFLLIALQKDKNHAATLQSDYF